MHAAMQMNIGNNCCRPAYLENLTKQGRQGEALLTPTPDDGSVSVTLCAMLQFVFGNTTFEVQAADPKTGETRELEIAFNRAI
eukprot:1182003-Prorocentrum_minimum.AAC.3